MCGRYTLTTDVDELRRRFEFADTSIEFTARYNIAPTNDVLTVTTGSDRQARFMRWGLIPYSAKAIPKVPIINARDDSVTTNGLFRSALSRRRCLILADGFYEWRKDGKLRTPFRYVLKSREPFAFGGLWSVWHDRVNGSMVSSCAIITTSPNELTAAIHDRMPVMLPEEAEGMWLDPAIEDAGVLTALLKPLPAGSLDTYAVSRAVNSVRNDEPSCIIPIGAM